MKIAIDCGGVLFRHGKVDHIEDTTSLVWNTLARESLVLLENHELSIISFAGKKRGRETIEVFGKTILPDGKPFLTVIPMERVHIVSSRYSKYEIIVAEHLEMMIDDREDILEVIMREAPWCHLVHFNPNTGNWHPENPKWHHVRNWTETMKLVESLGK